MDRGRSEEQDQDKTRMPASDRICSSIWQNSTILHVIDPSAGGLPREWNNGARGKQATYLWRFISGPLVAHEADRDIYVARRRR